MAKNNVVPLYDEPEFGDGDGDDEEPFKRCECGCKFFLLIGDEFGPVMCADCNEIICITWIEDDE